MEARTRGWPSSGVEARCLSSDVEARCLSSGVEAVWRPGACPAVWRPEDSQEVQSDVAMLLREALSKATTSDRPETDSPPPPPPPPPPATAL
ncbi:hypothetical protein ACOMHN_060620 [Nucella lapillus]